MGNRYGSKRGPYKHHQPPRQCGFPGCDNIFTPINSNQHYCTCTHYVSCKVCNSPIKVVNNSVPPRTCSKECARILQETTTEARYGVKHALQSPELLEKARQTNLRNLGVPYPMQSEECKEKAKSTFLHKYGVDNPFKSEQVKASISETVKSIYGVPWFCLHKKCRSSSHAISKINKEAVNYLEGCGVHTETEFTIGRYSYDIHIVNTNVVIEINPSITHNMYTNPWNTGIRPMYHFEKTRNAFDAGYICINIFDWDDLYFTLDNVRTCLYFKLDGQPVPRLHFYRNSDQSHIVYDSQIDEKSYRHFIEVGYFPVLDSGYNIDYLYFKEGSI